MEIGNQKLIQHTKKDGKNYIVNGNDGTIERNIYIKGDLIVCGNNHVVLSGQPMSDRKDLIVEGDLIVCGNNHDISSIVELGGRILNKSSRILNKSNRSIIR